MATIFYSMAGEGRGHATRVMAMVERLRERHRLVLLAPDEAYDFLLARYGDYAANVRLCRIEGLRFRYTAGKLDLVRSVLAGLQFLRRLPRITAEIVSLMREEKADLAISDFEGALPRAARRLGVPLIVINHQNFAEAYDLSILPASLRWYAWTIALVVKAHHRHQVATVVSAFFRPPLRRGYEQVVQVGPLLRPEVAAMAPCDGGFVLSYLRRHTPERVLELLKKLGRPVKVYGLGSRPAEGTLSFWPVDERRYVEDLASCSAYIGAAGNQSLGELLYFGKPVLALPEPKHHEQLINSHFIRHMGVGDFVLVDRLTAEDLDSFFARVPQFHEQLRPLCGTLDGTMAALSVVERFLGEHGAAPASRALEVV